MEDDRFTGAEIECLYCVYCYIASFFLFLSKMNQVFLKIPRQQFAAKCNSMSLQPKRDECYCRETKEMHKVI